MIDDREFLRHTLATLAYRGAKVIRDAPLDFADTRSCPTCRSAGEVLAHMGDLMEWALSAVRGHEVWRASAMPTWDDESARFFAAIAAFDQHLASDQPLACPAAKLFQGPIADALTHVGQLATLRRIAGSPVRGENYFIADISAGEVGPEQPQPRLEF